MRRLKRSRYITGFDGIRTLAVIAVIFYHLFPYAMQGGLMGVSIFFVISGYLITDLLLQEWEQNRKIDVKAFYIRRMKRLYPGLITMLVGTIAYITLFQKSYWLIFEWFFWQIWHQYIIGIKFIRVNHILINLRFSLLLHIYGRYLLKDNSICFGLYWLY